MNDHLAQPGGKVRLYVEAPLGDGARVQATEGQAHYLLHVMRGRAGDRVSLFNGRDGEWLARVVDVTKRSCALECERQTRPQAGTPDLWLCFAPIKKSPVDYLTQKATELGVSVLQPVITRRTIVARVNTERMRANAIEAAEQSDRLTVPEVREPAPLQQLLATWSDNRRLLFCDEAGGAPPIVEALATQSPPPLAGGGELRERSESNSGEGVEPLPQSSHASHARIAPSPASPSATPRQASLTWHAEAESEGGRKGRGGACAILTGPEGGFDPAEREAIRGLPFVTPMSLGPRILRADTAALAALAVWQALAGDWR